MKNKVLFIVLLFLSIFFCGCNLASTNNEIYNKTYDVNISIQEFEELVVAVGEKCDSGTIGVATYSSGIFGSSLLSTGSGFIYEGYAVLKNGSKITLEESKTASNISKYVYRAITNEHVISGASKVKAYLGEKYGEFSAEILAYDRQIDLAAISFECNLYLQPLELYNSDNVKKGQFAIAIGSSNGFEYFNSLTIGSVSYPNRIVEDNGVRCTYIQTDVTMNPGNSGGPLLNLDGKVIGVVTMKIINSQIDGLGFAITSNLVKDFINKRVK